MHPKESSGAIIAAFGSDLNELNKVREHLGDSGFVARVFVRTIFSVFDGYAWYLKQRALEGAPNAGIEFGPDELEMIHERRVKTLASGEKTEVPNIIQTKENLKFAIRIYARERGAEPPLVDNALPSEFRVVAEVRNRITHPKSAADFNVTQSEGVAVARLLEWFMRLVSWAGEQEQTSISEATKRINEMFEEAKRNHPPPRRDESGE
jgi:hypothetical protein